MTTTPRDKTDQVVESMARLLLEYEPDIRKRPADVAAAIMGALELYSILSEPSGEVALRDLLFRLRRPSGRPHPSRLRGRPQRRPRGHNSRRSEMSRQKLVAFHTSKQYPVAINPGVRHHAGVR